MPSTFSMPPSSSRHPETRQSRRSHLSSPYHLPPRNHAGPSRSHTPNPFHIRPADNLCVPQQGVLFVPDASRSPAPSNLTHSQNSTGPFGIHSAPGYSSGQPSQVSGYIVDWNLAPNHPQNSVAQPSVHLSRLSESMDVIQSQHPPLPLHSLSSPIMPSQQSMGMERQSAPSGEDKPPSHHQNQGMFKNAHSFTITRPSFIEGNVTLTNINTSSDFMRDLLGETIPGAASDSSARYPPPRCHPGTRLAVLDRCLHFIAHSNGQKKMRWVFGAAGVGKSAIMQSVADTPQLPVASNASVFFSINGRDDGTKVIMTLSYQFAAKSETYRAIIGHDIARDPSLLQASMPVQFEKFIVQPFIHNHDLKTAGRVLIIIDGLDECNKTDTQVDLLQLISCFCISYPSSPIVWLIASRPEPHITSFFSRAEVMPAYEKEEIAVDSDQARADVERYLREKLTEIRDASDSLDPAWPDEQDLWKLAKAAGGLFAYAHTVIRYIGDSNVGDPVSQLSDVLNVIDEHPMPDIPREEHPMALLDALYARILSKIPPKIMINTRKLLLALASNWDSALKGADGSTFIVLCNWLGMTADESYAAINRLRSVLNFPKRHNSHTEALKPFHKSFVDYLLRSGFSPDIKLEAQQVMTNCAFRVLKEAPSGIEFGNDSGRFRYGRLASRRGADCKILISWPVDKRTPYNDNETQREMYKLAIGEVVAGMKRGDSAFQTKSCIKLLTNQFASYDQDFPHYQLLNLVEDKTRRLEYLQ